MKTQQSPVSHPRHAFTLLELLIVIVIISVLIGLLLPAILQVLGGTADTAKVVSEVTQLTQALQMFQAEYGEYPPSSITIPVPGDPWSVSDQGKIKTVWPRFDFATNGGLTNTVELKLNGAECLAFFLGGIQNGDTNSPRIFGFSKNPQTPWTSSENPSGPFMEFDLGRLSDVDGDNMFEYMDPIPEQTSPYLYISAAGKRINRDNDVDDDEYDVFGDYDSFGNNQKDLSFCYVQADGKTPYREDSFQIISPGNDGLYGTGGVYSPGVELVDKDLNGANGVMNEDDAAGLKMGEFDPLDSVEVRAAEADNITNFSDGNILQQ